MSDIRAARVSPAAAVACALAALVSSCRSTSPEACAGAGCLAVAGAWSESTLEGSVDCGNNHLLSFGAHQLVASLTQTNEVLSLQSITSMPGVLHEDGSAIFGPVSAEAQPQDGMSSPEPGKLSLAGFFTQSGATLSFAGTYVFVADRDGCEVDSKASWRR